MSSIPWEDAVPDRAERSGDDQHHVGARATRADPPRRRSRAQPVERVDAADAEELLPEVLQHARRPLRRAPYPLVVGAPRRHRRHLGSAASACRPPADEVERVEADSGTVQQHQRERSVAAPTNPCSSAGAGSVGVAARRGQVEVPRGRCPRPALGSSSTQPGTLQVLPPQQQPRAVVGDQGRAGRGVEGGRGGKRRRPRRGTARRGGGTDPPGSRVQERRAHGAVGQVGPLTVGHHGAVLKPTVCTEDPATRASREHRSPPRSPPDHGAAGGDIRP